MKKQILIWMLCFVAGFAKAQNNSANAPVFSFVAETHDFGNLLEGPEAEVDFIFTNTGKEPLIIQQCTASCGCTTPDWTKEPILPGQRGNIKVKYATKDRVGTFNKTVYIRSNAKSDKERYEINIKGNVIAVNNPDRNIKINPPLQTIKGK